MTILKKTQSRLNAKQLRDLPEASSTSLAIRHPIYFILDNVYDTYNIGGLFRLADGFNITELIITGDSETPPNHRIQKASIGTYKIVPWRYETTAVAAIKKLRKEVPGIQVVAIEQTPGSVTYTEHEYATPLALVLGNETSGASGETLAVCDGVVEIPMQGVNFSLNVIVSAGVVLGEIYRKLELY